MIIQKRVQKEVELDTQKIDLEKAIKENKALEGLIYKIRDINEKSYFVLLENKPEAQNEDAEGEVNESEDKEIKSTNRLNDHFQMNSKLQPVADKEFAFSHEDKKEDSVKHILTGRIIVESEGVLYNLSEHEEVIEDENLVRTLSIKDCFTIKELEKKDFKIIDLTYADANNRFGKDILNTLLHSEQINISIKEIFANREKFPITKIKYTVSGETILVLDYYKEIKYMSKTEKEDNIKTFMDVLNKYGMETDESSFISNFRLNALWHTITTGEVFNPPNNTLRYTPLIYIVLQRPLKHIKAHLLVDLMCFSVL